MPWWISWKRAECVGQMRAAPLMVSVTPMRWIDCFHACSVPSVSDEARWVSRESTAWIAGRPSVSVVASEPAAVDGFGHDLARASNVVSSDFRRLSTFRRTT